MQGSQLQKLTLNPILHVYVPTHGKFVSGEYLDLCSHWVSGNALHAQCLLHVFQSVP
jgi:hypothetical protein